MTVEQPTMPRVNFYLLSIKEEHAALEFVCRLTEKVFRQGLPVEIICRDERQAKSLDTLLYSFREDSFIPHTFLQKQPVANEIDSQLGPAMQGREVVITLGSILGEQAARGDLPLSHENSLLIINLTDEAFCTVSLANNLNESSSEASGDERISDVPEFVKIAEIVRDDPEAKKDSRQKYRKYQEKGFTVNTHSL